MARLISIFIIYSSFSTERPAAADPSTVELLNLGMGVLKFSTKFSIASTGGSVRGTNFFIKKMMVPRYLGTAVLVRPYRTHVP